MPDGFVASPPVPPWNYSKVMALFPSPSNRFANLVTNQSVVGDLAGQALLETGILESREVHLSGSDVDASGSIRSSLPNAD